MGRVLRLATLGAPAGGGGGFVGPLDGISTAVAFSTRRLFTTYKGNCVLLRRSSDDAEMAFGFTSAGDLDTAAITAWLAGGDAFVKTWYDQSGNSRDVTQATAGAQPPLTLSVAAINNRPALVVAGASYLEASAATLFSGSAGTCCSVLNRTTSNGILVDKDRIFKTSGGSSERLTLLTGNGTDSTSISSSFGAFPTGYRIAVAIADGATGYFFSAGVAAGSGTLTNQLSDVSRKFSLFGTVFGGLLLTGGSPEIIILDGAISDANANIIGASQGEYYNLSWANFT